MTISFKGIEMPPVGWVVEGWEQRSEWRSDDRFFLEFYRDCLTAWERHKRANSLDPTALGTRYKYLITETVYNCLRRKFGK
jgi:hypothetical protein